MTIHHNPLVKASGREAYLTGKQRGWDCPYVADLYARRDWQAGWDAARETRKAQIQYLIETSQ